MINPLRVVVDAPSSITTLSCALVQCPDELDERTFFVRLCEFASNLATLAALQPSDFASRALLHHGALLTATQPTQDGAAYGYGANKCGQLGLGNTAKVTIPTRIEGEMTCY